MAIYFTLFGRTQYEIFAADVHLDRKIFRGKSAKGSSGYVFLHNSNDHDTFGFESVEDMNRIYDAFVTNDQELLAFYSLKYCGGHNALR